MVAFAAEDGLRPVRGYRPPASSGHIQECRLGVAGDAGPPLALWSPEGSQPPDGAAGEFVPGVLCSWVPSLRACRPPCAAGPAWGGDSTLTLDPPSHSARGRGLADAVAGGVVRSQVALVKTCHLVPVVLEGRGSRGGREGGRGAGGGSSGSLGAGWPACPGTAADTPSEQGLGLLTLPQPARVVSAQQDEMPLIFHTQTVFLQVLHFHI